MYESSLIQKRDPIQQYRVSFSIVLKAQHELIKESEYYIYFIVYCFQKHFLDRPQTEEYNPQ